jgi:hypothetical protein
MDEQYLSPNQMSEGYEPEPVQNFAIGGIALPGQRAFLRGSDKNYLDQRAKELEAYEAQRQAYNSALTKYQEEVYNPYSSQYDAYAKAVEDWNAGPRTEDYAGPAEPTLKAFDMKAPELAFKEADVKEYQKAAGQRAQRDAASRAVAIDVASNPDKFNFGSMSVAGRFMAEGGPVESDDNDEMFEGIAQELGDNTRMSREQIMEAVDRVAAAGRGGDELLAYLSPESVELLKQMGGSGTTNPDTGLPEFFFRRLRQALNRIFGRSNAAPAPAPAPAPAAAPIPIAERVSAPVMGTPAPAPAAPSVTAKDQLDAIKAVDKSNETYNQPGGPGYALNKPATPQLSDAIAQLKGNDKQGAEDTMRAIVGLPPLKRMAPAPMPEKPQLSDAIARLKGNDKQGAEDIMRAIVGLPPINRTGAKPPGPGLVAPGPSPIAPPPSSVVKPNFGFTRDPNEIGTSALVKWRNTKTGETYTAPDGATRPPSSDWVRDDGDVIPQPSKPSPVTPPPSAVTPPLPDIPIGRTPTPMPIFGQPPAAPKGPAVDPKNYFGIAPPSPSQGISPGTRAIGSPDMPLEPGKITMGAIGANKNLSPTILGGQENAGFITDRLGNRIYAPASPLLFAEGGLADVNAYNMSDSEEEQINTDPMGSAQKMMADLMGSKKASPNEVSVKRVAKSSGGAKSGKEMTMGIESLMSAKALVPELKGEDSARSQMEALALAYKLKAREAENTARGLMRNTMGAPTLEKPALTKNSLVKKRFAKGGEAKKSEEAPAQPEVTGVSKLVDFIAQRLPAGSFPTAGKVFLESVQGNKGPITESSFSKDELEVLKKLAKGQKGVVRYEDYQALVEDMRKEGKSADATSSFFSLGSPVGNVRNTLGGFTYSVDPSGNMRVTDTYDFNPRDKSATQEARTGDYGAFGPFGLMREYAGEKIPPGYGRQVDINLGPAVKRAEGSPKEGEVSQEELDAASRPAFVTPKSGIGRRQGPISRALNSGEAYVNMAKGVTELPYDIAGAPVDIATMALRPLGYGVDKPVMGSDWIKEKMTAAKVRPEPPKDATDKGFYTAGQLLSNLTNPAGVTRSGVRAVQRAGEAASDAAKDFQQYNRQLAAPGASYAVRPVGSTVLTGRVGLDKDVSEIEKVLRRGVDNARSVAGQNASQEDQIKEFWEKKARNYFTRQFGTPDDPVAAAIAKNQIKGSVLDELFPDYMIAQIGAGKTRVNEQGQSRFFPKYPRAMEDFTKRYDRDTGLKGNLITSDPAALEPGYNFLSAQGRSMSVTAAEREADKMIAQGVRPELINTLVGTVARSITDPSKIASADGTGSSKALLAAFEEASAYNKMTPEQQLAWANDEFGKGRMMHGLDYEDVGKNLLADNVRTAIEKGEPVYDVGYMGSTLKSLFNAENINTYLSSLPPRELNNIRFEDAVRGGVKVGENQFRIDNLIRRIQSGKPIPDKVFSDGVSSPLLQFDKDSGLGGFAWKRIEKREATVPEGAYVGHSVGGYELGGATYTSEKREGFNSGLYQIYTLRDARNRPVNTVEVKMEQSGPVVTQIKGNGRATGNTAPEKYDGAVLRFLQTYLKPVKIKEDDRYLTPLLTSYKDQLNNAPAP